MARWEPRILALNAVKAYVLLSRAASVAGCSHAVDEAVDRLLLKMQLSWTCILFGCVVDASCEIRDDTMYCGPEARTVIKALYMLYGIVHPERVLCADGIHLVLDSVGVDGLKQMLEDCARIYVTIHVRVGADIDAVLNYVYRMVDSVHREMGSMCVPV